MTPNTGGKNTKYRYSRTACQILTALAARWHPLCMQRLQSLHANLSALQRGDAIGRGPCRGERGDRRDAGGYGGASDGFLVEVRVGAAGRVNDELNALGLDHVDCVGTSFFDFVDALDGETGGFDDVGGAVGGDEFESHVDEAVGDVDHLRLVVVGHTDENSALGRQHLAGGDLRFGKGFAKVVGDAH